MDTIKFSEIFEFQKKSTIKAGDGLSEGIYSFYTSSTNPSKYINAFQHNRSSLIFGTGGNANIHLAENPFSASTDCLVAQLKDNIEHSINIKFVYYYLFGNIWILEKGFKGAGLKHISKEYISQITIPKFTLYDQNRIVKILDQADALRQKRKLAIALLDEYVKSVFLEMFGDPIENLKNLEVIKFGEVIDDIRYGSSRKSIIEFKENSVPILRIPNIAKGEINYSDLQYQILPSSEKDKLILRKGDILFVRSNGNPDYIGRCAVFEDHNECIYASYLIRVRVTNDSLLNPLFIRYCLSMDSYKQKIRKESRTTAGNYNINTLGIKNFDLIKPSVKQQNEFLSLFHSTQSIKQKMINQSEELENQFQALMQKSFSIN